MTTFVLILAFLLLIVAPPIFVRRRRVTRARAARESATAWPTVPGRILVSRPETDGDLERATPGAAGAVILYEYVVEGRTYRSSVVDLGDAILLHGRPDWSMPIRVQAEDALRRYPQGATVQVYVDPANPERSCLEAGGF